MVKIVSPCFWSQYSDINGQHNMVKGHAVFALAHAYCVRMCGGDVWLVWITDCCPQVTPAAVWPFSENVKDLHLCTWPLNSNHAYLRGTDTSIIHNVPPNLAHFQPFGVAEWSGSMVHPALHMYVPTYSLTTTCAQTDMTHTYVHT